MKAEIRDSKIRDKKETINKEPAGEEEVIRELSLFLKKYHRHLPAKLDGWMRDGLVSFWNENRDELQNGIAEKDTDDIYELFETLKIAQPDDEKASCSTWNTVQTVNLGRGAGTGVVLLRIAMPREMTGRPVRSICGHFASPERGIIFDYKPDGENLEAAAAVGCDWRFLPFFTKLGKLRLEVLLGGRMEAGMFDVCTVNVADPASAAGSGMTDELLQLMTDRLLTAPVRKQTVSADTALPLSNFDMIGHFLDCAGASLPDNIEQWGRRTLSMCENTDISADEKRHARRALSMALNIRWRDSHFDDIDPAEARRILDEELYGMEEVKQRVIETIIQINRTHTLPSYGLLLAGPAGTGKSQIAYAVARILKIPWAVLDMSTIKDAEALTGTSRIYGNAKPGLVMEAFARAGSSNIVFVINELDKANHDSTNGNPADVLLTLLDNLGFTDNYIECAIPTGGVYPIATANNKNEISLPLLSRFTVIDIPAYTTDEKKVIFQRYSLPNALLRTGMKPEECVVPDDAVDLIVDEYAVDPGCRDLEQIAEHLAGHALYEIVTRHLNGYAYTKAGIRGLMTGSRAPESK